MAEPSSQIEYKLLTDDRIEEVLLLQRETMQEECVAIGVGIPEEPGASEEMQVVFREVIKDGVTLIAVDTETNQLAAVAFNKIHVRPKTNDEKDDFVIFMEENLKHKSCIELAKFLGDVESKVDIFEKYNIDGAMELFYLGTNSKYQGRGIGFKIVQASIELARQRQLLVDGSRNQSGESLKSKEVIPKLVFGVFASIYSQRIVEKLGFENLVEVRYENLTCNGKKMSERINSIHETAIFAALKL